MSEVYYDPIDKLFSYLSTRKMQVQVKTSMDAYERMYPLFSFSFFPALRERFCALFLDDTGKQVSQLKCSFEANPFIMVDINRLLEECRKVDARKVVIAHSSVTNDTRPTEQDHAFTTVIKEECNQEGILLQDHLIISEYGMYYSFADNGLL